MDVVIRWVIAAPKFLGGQGRCGLDFKPRVLPYHHAVYVGDGPGVVAVEKRSVFPPDLLACLFLKELGDEGFKEGAGLGGEVPFKRRLLSGLFHPQREWSAVGVQTHDGGGVRAADVLGAKGKPFVVGGSGCFFNHWSADSFRLGSHTHLANFHPAFVILWRRCQVSSNIRENWKSAVNSRRSLRRSSRMMRRSTK